MSSEPEATTPTAEQGENRRRRRAKSGPIAVELQLRQVAEGLALDAIVLADDLGRVLAHAGSLELSRVLANSAMWAPEGVDGFTIEHARHRCPNLEPDDVVAESVDVPGADGAKLIAAGKSFALRTGVDHAIDGIKRICTEWLSAKPRSRARSQPGYRWPVDRKQTAPAAA